MTDTTDTTDIPLIVQILQERARAAHEADVQRWREERRKERADSYSSYCPDTRKVEKQKFSESFRAHPHGFTDSWYYKEHKRTITDEQVHDGFPWRSHGMEADYEPYGSDEPGFLSVLFTDRAPCRNELRECVGLHKVECIVEEEVWS